MEKSKIERCVSAVVISACLIKAVLYGGSKPPMPTNPPPDSASSPTNPPMTCAGSLRGRGLSQTSQVGQSVVASGGLGNPAAPVMFEVISNWTARGAYCDWQRIEFPPSFQFPVGTNFIDSVMLMAYGEIKSNLHCSTSTSDFDFSLPSRVSIEPNVSSVTHGLTPSNSYLFSWHNCCVNRNPTNRVDASIELFDSGAVAIRTSSDVQPPTYNLQPPIVPEGFYGHGQDDAWLAASFPSHYAAITNLGYDAWLDGHIGHNEPNGRYKLSVTIATLPEHGPCYLFCGPYKMVVTSPGTYCFPLEVFEEYRAYTLPTRVPLSFEYDDGYDYPTQPLMAGAPLMAPRSVPDYYIICMTPHVYVVPQHIPLSEAVGTRLNLLCNCPNGTWSYTSYFENHLRLTFGFPSYAEIQTAEVADRVTVIMRVAGHECSGVFFIDPPPSNDNPPPHNCCNACCGDDCRCDGTCCICSCGCHSDANSSTNSTEAEISPVSNPLKRPHS